jgi:hypothetical protein
MNSDEFLDVWPVRCVDYDERNQPAVTDATGCDRSIADDPRGLNLVRAT